MPIAGLHFKTPRLIFRLKNGQTTVICVGACAELTRLYRLVLIRISVSGQISHVLVDFIVKPVLVEI